MSKRQRRRANEIANIKTGKPWFTIMMIVLGLVVIFAMRSTIGDDTAGLFTQLVGDPDLVLPESVSDKTSKSSVPSRSKTFRVIVDQTKDMKSPRTPDMGTQPNSGEQ